MHTFHSHSLPSRVGADAVAGCWKLGEGRALTLRPSEPGELRIAHGMVWVTFENASRDEGVRGGDHFLGAGDKLQLAPGQVLVMESWGPPAGAAAYFSWDPLPVAAVQTVASAPRRVFAAGGVVQPLRDLRLAFGMAAGASGRLVLGLAGAALEAGLAILPRPLAGLIAGRARTGLAARAFSAQSSDSRAQCAIS